MNNVKIYVNLTSETTFIDLVLTWFNCQMLPIWRGKERGWDVRVVEEGKLLAKGVSLLIIPNIHGP